MSSTEFPTTHELTPAQGKFLPDFCLDPVSIRITRADLQSAPLKTECCGVDLF